MRKYGGNGSDLIIHLDSVSCSGTESMLTECNHSGVGTYSCEEAAVICSGEESLTRSAVLCIPMQRCVQMSYSVGLTCEEGTIRLVGSYDVKEGRVEYCSNNTWYSVCGDGWQEPEANVVCSTLGYSTSLGKERAYSGIQ